MTQRLVELTNTVVSIEAQLNNGRTGATALVAIREADTTNSWLDFNDNTFKTVGWTTRQQTMAEVSAGNTPGLYRTTIDITALLPARVAGDRLVAEFDVSASGPNLQVNGIEKIALVTELDNIAAPGAEMDLVTDAVDSNAVATSGANEIRDTILDDATRFSGADIDTTISSRATPGDEMDLVVDAVDAASVASNAIDDDALAADTDTYQAKVWLFDDNSANTDRYAVAWFKNGQPQLSGVTVPTIQVIEVATGGDLVGSTAMVAVGATGYFRHDEATPADRVVSGRAYIAEVTATIDGLTRTWAQPVGRDSG